MKPAEQSGNLDLFIQFHTHVQITTGNRIKTFRMDNGMECCSREFNGFCLNNGICHQFSNVYTPQQNAVAERSNRTMEEHAI